MKHGVKANDYKVSVKDLIISNLEHSIYGYGEEYELNSVFPPIITCSIYPGFFGNLPQPFQWLSDYAFDTKNSGLQDLISECLNKK